MVLFAKTPEDLPVCSKVGEIIRVHRSHVTFFNGNKQFNLNMFYNSSWALFHGVDSTDIKPFAYSGNSMTLEGREASILKNLQKWAKQVFKDHTLINPAHRTLLSAIPKVGGQQSDGKYADFDLHCKIV